MEFALAVVVIVPALIVRACRPGPFHWPAQRSWFDIVAAS